MWALGDLMRGLDYVAATTGSEEEREAADWRARRLDLVLWEPEDCPELWSGFIPGFPAEQVGDEWHSLAWGVEFLVLSPRSMEMSDQVSRRPLKRLHLSNKTRTSCRQCSAI